MAEYQGRKVTLDKPTRITKAQAGYGRKKFQVYNFQRITSAF